jgi:hypothetical protein
VNDSCLKRPVQKKASGIAIYLLEELGDARLRCAQLKKYIDEAVTLINKSEHRDHFFETAAHLIYGIPDTLLRMDKALSAAALAASKLDYEEIKEELRPEKVEELEKALEEVRVKRVQRQSEEKIKIPTAIAKLEHLAASAEATGKINSVELAGLVSQLEGQTKTATSDEIASVFRELATSLVSGTNLPSRLLLASTLRRILADTINVSELEVQSRFEEGKPADPTQNMSPEDAKKWWEEHKKNKDNFKTAVEEHDAEMGVESRFEEGKPADPTENMNSEDAKKWKEMNEEHGDRFKAASWKTDSAKNAGAFDFHVQPNKLFSAMEKSVASLLDTRVKIRDASELLLRVQEDATGIVWTDVYRNPEILKVSRSLHALDWTIGDAYKDVERLEREMIKLVKK